MSNLRYNEIYKQLNREIVTKSLSHEEGKFVYSQELLDYIAANMNAEDKRACKHLNLGQMPELLACSPDSVMKARTLLAEMMRILCNRRIKTLTDLRVL